MKTGIKGIEIIKRFEGCKLKSYKCPAGVWTIGYGHTQGVKEGMVITQAQADSLLKDDLASYERDVLSLGLNINQNQFDALVSLCYNIGITNLRTSTLVKRIKTKASEKEIRDAFAMWNKAGGKVLQGLVSRRKAEADLCFS